jgi:hypothetical protein
MPSHVIRYATTRRRRQRQQRHHGHRLNQERVVQDAVVPTRPTDVLTGLRNVADASKLVTSSGAAPLQLAKAHSHRNSGLLLARVRRTGQIHRSLVADQPTTSQIRH